MTAAPGDVPAGAGRESDAFAATVQLANVYLWQARMDRAGLAEPLEGPTLESQVVGHDVSDNGLEIRVLLNVKVTHQFRDGACGVLDVILLGEFVSLGEPFSEDVSSQYARTVATPLMWPYARAIVGQFGQMTQLDFPPLPTLDVLGAMSHLASLNHG